MRVRTDLGTRVELVSMDPHFEDVTIGLYRRETDDGPIGIVHSYSSRTGIDDRLGFIAEAMVLLGGLERVDGETATVRLPCRSWHNAALKRLFLDCFRVDPATRPEPRPLAAPDTRSEQFIRLEPLGSGRYRVEADDVPEGEASRAPAIARALVRLAQVDEVDETAVAFSCGADHDALMGLLLVRAQNLRAALREEELTASRGVLTAPSAQEQA
jgi:hypothetical protein